MIKCVKNSKLNNYILSHRIQQVLTGNEQQYGATESKLRIGKEENANASATEAVNHHLGGNISTINDEMVCL